VKPEEGVRGRKVNSRALARASAEMRRRARARPTGAVEMALALACVELSLNRATWAV
jgi:hypothetical protein